MTHYIGVVASLAIRRSPASTQPANFLLIPAPAPRIGARGRVHCYLLRSDTLIEFHSQVLPSSVEKA